MRVEVVVVKVVPDGYLEVMLIVIVSLSVDVGSGNID